MNGLNVLIWLVFFGVVIYLQYVTPFKSKNLNIAYGIGVVVVAALLWGYVYPKLTEGFNPDTRVDQPCPEGSIKHRNGDCRMKGEGEAP